MWRRSFTCERQAVPNKFSDPDNEMSVLSSSEGQYSCHSFLPYANYAVALDSLMHRFRRLYPLLPASNCYPRYVTPLSRWTSVRDCRYAQRSLVPA